ncbi:MAG TPA: adenylate/guanylate cyclase domain-containing protein, partial [Myxococcota bacterium]|nr:adenylate/guanylate cyclase domain-containing protein [Myxococcota bacterium]
VGRASVKDFTVPGREWPILSEAGPSGRRASLGTGGSGRAIARPGGGSGMPRGLEAMERRLPAALLGAAAIVLGLLLSGAGVFEELELGLYDRAIRRQVGRAPGPAPVLGVTIGETEFQRYGYPIPDALLAEALERLVEAGAVAIGVDLYRDGPASGSAEDLAGWIDFETVVRSTPRIVTSELMPSADEPGTPPPTFVGPEQVGFNNLLMDRGRVVRRGYLIAWDEVGNAHLSLTLRLALLALAEQRVGMQPDPERPEWIRLGATTLPPLEPDFGAYVDLDAGGYQFPLDYARPDDAFAVLAFEDVVEGRFDPARVRGRVVVLGTDSPSVKDDFNAPFAAGRVVKGYRLHAHIVDQLIRTGEGHATPLTSLDAWTETVWIVAWGVLGIVLSMGITSLGWAVPTLLLGLLLLGAAWASLFAAGIWVPGVAPAFAWAAAGGLTLGDRARREARAQRELMGLFRRFASRHVADHLWSRRDEFMDGHRLKSQRVTITALLSDLKGYTEAAEKMEPDELMEWIESYMDAMTRVIESYDGAHVDDYVGDGIKANFGVPIPSEDEAEIARDARNAVCCALEMGRTLERLNASWRARGWPTGRQRIGLHTGPAVVGAIGGNSREGRLKYTSVGDTVNTAARLESIGGALDFDREDALSRVLIGEPTRRLLGDDFVLRDEGLHEVKGKSEPIRIYRVLGERAHATAAEGEQA